MPTITHFIVPADDMERGCLTIDFDAKNASSFWI